MLSGPSKLDDFADSLEMVFIGSTEKTVLPFRVLETTWQPKGLRLKLEGFGSDTAVKEHRGESVFVDRAALPETEEGEFYVEDLIGFDVRDAQSDETLGTLSGVESVAPGCPDRWWVSSETDSFAFPASNEIVARLDSQSKTVWIRNGNEFQTCL